ncbi:hypothetical protein [Sphingomonas oryzagri]|uniref:Uncharacterized protein n=1 Tax=Sphingomonas oryzagri TaxID=3042314 RepID=A0ABT6MWV4_9SPHN|nr:hypothetical protein [Sphingomonas oryzagri]MDH7637292.1 hypothetical protein [Sphingomonas oryzagri]
MKRVRARLRAFGPLRLLDDCAALMILENGAEAEDEVRRAIDARPPLVQRIALSLVLRTVRRRQAETTDGPLSATSSPPAAETPAEETLRRIA